VLGQGGSFKTETTMVRKDGTRIWVNLIGYAVNPDELGQGTIVWMIEDRSAQKCAEESLRNALLENRAILDNAVMGIAVVENGRLLHCNRKMEELFHYPGAGMDGAPVRALYPDAGGWEAARIQTRIDFAAGRIHMAEHELVRRDGSRFWARLSGRPFDLDAARRAQRLADRRRHRPARSGRRAAPRARRTRGAGAGRTAELAANRLLQAEIVERRQAEARVHHMAYHDALTGLPNRALLSERLDRGDAGGAPRRPQAGRDVHRPGPLQDHQRFARPPDRRPPAEGSRAPPVPVVRAVDTVARLGGDEFVVLVPGVRTPTNARWWRQDHRRAGRTGAFEGRSLHISPSIGICLCPDDGADVATLMRKADAAMYHAKARPQQLPVLRRAHERGGGAPFRARDAACAAPRAARGIHAVLPADRGTARRAA
jgi:PAS domain S-box-containing protein